MHNDEHINQTLFGTILCLLCISGVAVISEIIVPKLIVENSSLGTQYEFTPR